MDFYSENFRTRTLKLKCTSKGSEFFATNKTNLDSFRI